MQFKTFLCTGEVYLASPIFYFDILNHSLCIGETASFTPTAFTHLYRNVFEIEMAPVSTV